MEFFLKILEIVCGSGLTLVGVVLVQRGNIKTKRMEIESKRDDALIECQAKHSENFDKVKSEFRGRLDIIDETLDSIKLKQTEIGMTVKQLEEKQDKYNNVIERTFNLEKSVEILLDHDKAKRA